MPARIPASRIRDHLPRTGKVWLAGCSGESALIRSGLAGADLSGLTLTGIYVPGLNRLDPYLAAGARVETFFMLPELAGRPAGVDFLPLSYREIGRHLARHPPQAALFQVSPPDGAGMCSFGTVTDFLADIWERIPLRIAHVNPCMPRTSGHPGIPFDSLTAVVEGEEELLESDPGQDEASTRIAIHAASVIPDGATVQAGIGRAPESVLRGLTGHRGLAVHSGLIGDSALALLEAEALRDGTAITTGVAIGTRRLYDAAEEGGIRFQPPSFTHDLAVLAGRAPLVTVNSAIEVDLSGQVFAEATPKGLLSGPGGASDFAAGARAGQGLRMIVLPATAGGGRISRIVRNGAGPVSLGRFDTDVVVTEFGVADLRGCPAQVRAERLAAIAAPEHRGLLGM